MDYAVSYFNENYNKDISIEQYAESRGMSVSWFIRNFKKYTGMTPMQFIVSRRINNAQLLLEQTNYSINEIAGIVGYDDQLYFSRLFRKQKGFSPSQYRKEGLVMNDRIITHQPANKIPNIKLRHLYRFNCCLCL